MAYSDYYGSYYGGGSGRGGGGGGSNSRSDYYGGGSSYDSNDYGNIYGSAGPEEFDYGHGKASSKFNPEYYDKDPGHGHEAVRGSYEDEEAKKFQVQSFSICIDYIRGHCPKGNRCPKPHTDYVESIDEREILSKLKFCHDYQNRGMCQRAGCKFLHVTRREEDEFLLTGSVPQTVFERMREWVSENDPNYTTFQQDDEVEGGRGRGRGGGFRGRGSGYGDRGRGGGGSFGDRGRGGFRGRGSDYGGRGSDYGGRGGGFRGRGGNSYGSGGGEMRGRGGGSGYQQKRSYDSMSGGRDGGDWRGTAKFFRGAGGGRGRGGGGGYGSKHSNSLPVTYENICVDFLKGTCAKAGRCLLVHAETIEETEIRVGLIKQVFCHDFQNGTCNRGFCKFIHASREEEGFFLENGYFPPSMNARNREKLFYSDICLDFLRSQCIRGSSCNYKHVENVELYSERLCLSRSIFCHDFQDGNCTRQPCKMVHTSKESEKYFLDTGHFPRNLHAHPPPSTQYSATNAKHNPALSRIAQNVCREFVKRQCTRGSSCKFYHPTPQELEVLLSQQNSTGGGGGGGIGGGGGGGMGGGGGGGIVGKPQSPAPPQQTSVPGPSGEPVDNTALKSRVNQLERLLADACYCMTLAVGDQNPAISTLMKTISDMAPESSLANQADAAGASGGGDGGNSAVAEGSNAAAP